jgi:hypothetical protein
MDTSNRIVLHVLLRTYHITVIVRPQPLVDKNNAAANTNIRDQ